MIYTVELENIDDWHLHYLVGTESRLPCFGHCEYGIHDKKRKIEWIKKRTERENERKS